MSQATLYSMPRAAVASAVVFLEQEAGRPLHAVAWTGCT